jgi:hypothetical protein
MKDKFTRTIYVVFLAIVSHFSSFAQNTSLAIMEMIFGPTATNAVVGNGGLTVGLSKYGEMVNLRWPCSNYYDQLNFATIHPVPAYNKVEWYGRHLDTKEFMGCYNGIAFMQNGKQIISWFRDKEWTVTQSYLSNDAAIVVSKYIHHTLGIEIKSTDFVLPNTDAHCRSFTLEKSNNAITDVQLYNMSNIAMCNTMKPNDPSSDWDNDSKNGYVSFIEKDNDASVSFILNEASSKFKQLPSKNYLAGFINAVKSYYTKDETTIGKQSPNLDVFCAIGSNKKSLLNYLFKTSNFKINKLNNNNDVVNGSSITLTSYSFSLNENVQIIYSLAGSYSNCIKQLNDVKKENCRKLNC